MLILVGVLRKVADGTDGIAPETLILWSCDDHNIHN